MSAGELVDTHCHIQSAGVKRGERVTRELWAKAPELTAAGLAEAARKAGVTRMICVGCDLEDSRLAVDFARGRAGCRASAGIHPHEAKAYTSRSGAGSLADFAALARQPEVAAIGECGLDYYYGHSPKADQIKILEFQIGLALDTGKPLIFHVREAFDDFWPILDGYEGVRGVVHSFTDSSANLDKALERGLYVGVNGIATFAKNPALAEAYKSIPADRLLLETDAPFLTPTPYRGNINEPKRLNAVADFLAGLRGEEREELAVATTKNARELFGI
jgi:TatD DNase family protein